MAENETMAIVVGQDGNANVVATHIHVANCVVCATSNERAFGGWERQGRLGVAPLTLKASVRVCRPAPGSWPPMALALLPLHWLQL